MDREKILTNFCMKGQGKCNSNSSTPRTQMTAVKQKLLTVTYFSPENIPFAQKWGRKKCSGNSSNKKVILLYQPSTWMYIRTPA